MSSKFGADVAAVVNKSGDGRSPGISVNGGARVPDFVWRALVPGPVPDEDTVRRALHGVPEYNDA